MMIMMIERTDRHIGRIMAIVGSDQILSVFSAHNLPYQRERAAFIILSLNDIIMMIDRC